MLVIEAPVESHGEAAFLEKLLAFLPDLEPTLLTDLRVLLLTPLFRPTLCFFLLLGLLADCLWAPRFLPLCSFLVKRLNCLGFISWLSLSPFDPLVILSFSWASLHCLILNKPSPRLSKDLLTSTLDASFSLVKELTFAVQRDCWYLLEFHYWSLVWLVWLVCAIKTVF